MKKIYLLFAAILFAAGSFAQVVSGYNFAQSAGTFTALTGGTVSTATGDDGIQNGIPIGFTFNYDGSSYTHFSVTTNGFLKLGTAATTITGSFGGFSNALSNTATDRPLIAPLWDDNNATGGSVSYKLSGSDPNQTLTIEWTNIHIGGSGSSSNPTGSFQVILSQTSNVVQIVYGTINTFSSVSASIGLNGNTSFLSVTPGATATVSSATANNSVSSSTNLTTGTTYTFTPPAGCTGAPAAGTVSGPVGACSGVSFTLTNVGATNGAGMHYAWQSSTDNITFTNIAGQTSAPSATVSQTASTYYRLVDTCTTSGNLSAISNVIQITMNAPTACYCIPVFTTGCSADDFISTFSINTLNNSNSGCNGNTNSYINYASSAFTTSLSQGAAYTASLTSGVGSGTHGAAVWIDFNHNGDFQDPGEFFLISNSIAASATATGTVTIPAGALTGQTRMRVRYIYNTTVTQTSDCASSTYGETEDYTISITAGSPCTGIPSAGTTTASATIFCSSGSVTLSNAGAGPGIDINYQWQSSPNNSTWSDINGATTSSYVATVNTTTYYRLSVNCPTSHSTVFSNSVLVTISGTPANDLVCNATTLVLGGAADCGNTTCATSTGDPTFSNSTLNNTVWYKYTPAATGAIQITMSVPAGVTTGLLNGWLGIYTATGSCPSLTLTEVPTSLSYDLTANNSVILATPVLTAGTTYYFVIDGVVGAFGAYCIKADAPPPPPNCTTNISPANGATGISTPVTFSWNTVSGATSYTLFLGTNNPPVSTDSITTVATNSVIIVGGAANTTYYWYVVPKNAGGAASGCVSNMTTFVTANPPANDHCDQAIALSVGNGFCTNPILGTLTFADSTNGLGGANCQSSALKNDVWYSVAVQPGKKVNVQTSAINTVVTDLVMQAYTGTCAALTYKACDDDGNPEPAPSANHSRLVLTNTGTIDSIYYIRIMPYSSNTNMGPFAICAWDSAAASLPNVSAGTPGSCLTLNPITIDSLHANLYMWVPILDGSGNIVGELYPNGNALGNTADKLFKNNSGIPRQYNGQYYLDRNVTIIPTTQPGVVNKIKVKIYFTNAELLAMQAVSPGVTRSNLAFTKENSNCPSFYTATNAVFEGNFSNGAYKTDHFIETDTVSSFSTFFIQRNLGAPLPVTLVTFTAQRNGSVNELIWSTSQEINTSLFIVERSTDGRNFSPVGQVAAAGNSSNLRTYQFTDVSPVKGINYYRIRIVDRDNNARFSDVRNVRNNGNTDFAIYPNPVKDVMIVNINADKTDKGIMIITDISGKQVYLRQVNVAAGNNLINVDMSNISQGAYIIKVQLTNDMVVKKFNKM